MLSNAYFLAKFRFDTAENEPAKNLQKFANFANPNPPTLVGLKGGWGEPKRRCPDLDALRGGETNEAKPPSPGSVLDRLR